MFEFTPEKDVTMRYPKSENHDNGMNKRRIFKAKRMIESNLRKVIVIRN
jgi:hypothetical protein